METSSLAQSPIGSLVPITGFDPRNQREYKAHAFLPDPLPDEVVLSAKTYMAVTRATSMVARADQAVTQLPNPDLLARLALRREALSTSAIEGTYAAMEDVLKADFEDVSSISPEVAEIQNYVRAAEAATEWVKDRPVTISLLEHLQGILVRGTSSDTSQAGHVRTTDVFIGSKTARVEDARFIPCPHGLHLRDGLLQWEGWINKSSDDMPLLVRMAIGHYQFETLHPFNDGNGRLGRLVAMLQLMSAGELALHVIALSPWLEARRTAYQEQLFEVSATGDFEPWINFFCEAVTAQAKEAVERVGTLVNLKKGMLDTLHQAGSKGITRRIVEDLVGYPMLTITSAAEQYSVSYQAASNAVNRLVSLGLLRQFSEGKYGRIFINDAVLQVLVG
ncbi:Fic family protein [Streptomyces prunicolor]|uniref:Fic family protein n=1 Tax=Streptomyces prunicolor TaxID=67348 RepID=UPI0022501BA0|nr:Fic/DOC family N-terminal domain-containing protein [Streptomyces prunicolor]MCX5234983.1 Fic family protein [Streptomyces prunicolor]